jgi:ammonia channel protein AmtB
MEIYLILTLVLLWLITSGLASLYIGKAPAYDSSQKRLQILFIWIVPFITAALFSYFLWQDRREVTHKREVGNLTAFSDRDALDHYTGSNHSGGNGSR